MATLIWVFGTMTKNENDKYRVRFRKQNSGAYNRRVKQRREALEKSQKGSLSKFFPKIQEASPSGSSQHEEIRGEEPTEEAHTNEEIVVEELMEDHNEEDSNNFIENLENEGVNEEPIEEHNEEDPIHSNDNLGNEEHLMKKDEDVNYDPGLWGNVDDNKRILLVQRGPIKILKEHDNFQKDKESGRHFSSKHYTRLGQNGERQERRWLVYSNELNKVFCFCCKLFKHTYMKSKLAGDGIDDWHNLSRKLCEHESNPEHNDNVVKWVNLHMGLKKNATIDVALQALIDKERDRWKLILVRIIGVVKTLSRNSLPFRGSNEKIYEKNNGLFCQLVEFVAEFDQVMKEHLQRVVDNETQKHYLSHKIQNELIGLLASEIKEKILEKIQKAKYFSIILDYTSDLSHEEQMSIVIRCVNVEEQSKVKVEEFFLGFIKVDDTSGLGLFKQLEDVLIDLNLNIDDIRGQGYDNGANMKGKHQGVQKRLLDVNPRAFYIPCGCHSLNLALCDMVKSCTKARNFFSHVQRIYTLFSGSTQRWDVLRRYVSGLTPKPLSATRWESHVESVRAIRTQAPELRDALIEIGNKCKEDIVMEEAKGLCKNALEDFGFLISLCIWFKILDKVNRVSKILQKEEMDIEDAITRVRELIVFFEELREDGFQNLMNESKELANEVGIVPDFPPKRVVRRKKHFDEEIEDEACQSPEENFRINYFLHIIDQALTSLKVRFVQFEQYEAIYGFLLNVKFKIVSDEQLKEHCVKLEKFLEYNQHGDIVGKDLFQELRHLKTILPREITKAIDILDFIRYYCEEGDFQNVWVAYRILLTIPVTVASAERSFSKLTLIKTYLRTTMSQERLSGLAMISIENVYLDKLNYDDLIHEFASRSARRKYFC